MVRLPVVNAFARRRSTARYPPSAGLGLLPARPDTRARVHLGDAGFDRFHRYFTARPAPARGGSPGLASIRARYLDIMAQHIGRPHAGRNAARQIMVPAWKSRRFLLCGASHAGPSVNDD